MILSQKNIEEIAAAVTKDFNEFFYGNKSEDTRRMARGTPIDQFAKDYLGMNSRTPIKQSFPVRTSRRCRTS